MKIYIIDDNKFDLLINERMIMKACPDATIEKFNQPEEGLNRLISDIKNDTLPDLLFLDLIMPGLTGFDVLEALQKIGKNCMNGCGVFVVSSTKDTSDIEKVTAYSCVNKFLGKPLDLDELQNAKSLISA